MPLSQDSARLDGSTLEIFKTAGELCIVSIDSMQKDIALDVGFSVARSLAKAHAEGAQLFASFLMPHEEYSNLLEMLFQRFTSFNDTEALISLGARAKGGASNAKA